MNTIPEEKLRRMSPEKRAMYEKRLKQVKRNRRILASVVVFIIVALVGVVLSLTVLFKITTVNVSTPGKIYGVQDIINASGLEIGDNILTTKFEDAESRIERILPYVLEARISKTITGKVNISVTDDKPEVIFEAKNGYALADANGKVLEIIKEKPENSKYKLLKTKKKTAAIAGEEYGFVSVAEKELFGRICEALKRNGIYNDVTEIDFSEITNIKIVYKNRMRIKIGNYDDIDHKLQVALVVINRDNEENPDGLAEINVRDPDKVFVKNLDTLESIKESEDTKDKPAGEKTTAAEVVSAENGGEETTSGTGAETEENGEEEGTETTSEASSEAETSAAAENGESAEQNNSEEEN